MGENSGQQATKRPKTQLPLLKSWVLRMYPAHNITRGVGQST